MTEATLRIKVDSSEVAKADKSLDDLAVSSGKAEKGTTQLTASTNSLSNAARAATGFLAAMGATIGVREIIAYSDAWRGAENQLRLVTTGTAELAGIQQTLLGVANNTRSSFESTANLYSRLARATTEMGLSQSELIGITNTINQSFAVSGATASEAAAAITQLSQGLAAGALRGDEFNSVAEQAPGIMRAIADSLNMTVGELRGFAAEGGITAEIVVTALQKAAGSIENDFSRANATFSQSMVVAKNNMLEFVGGSEAVTTATGAAGRAVITLSENADTLFNVLAGGAALMMARVVPALWAMQGPLVAVTGSVVLLTSAFQNYQQALDNASTQAVANNIAAGADVITFAMYDLVQQMNAANAEIENLGGGRSAAGRRKELEAEIAALTVTLEQYALALGKTRQPAEVATATVYRYGENVKITTDAMDAHVEAQEAYQKAQEDSRKKVSEMIAELEHEERTLGMSERALLLYNTELEALAAGAGPAATRDIVARTAALYDANAATDRAQEATEAHNKATEQATEAMQRQWESTRDTLKGYILEFDNLGDTFERVVKDMAAEWAASGLMRLFGMSAPSSPGMVSGLFGGMVAAGGSAATTAAIGAGGMLGGIGAAGMPGGVAGVAGAGGGMMANIGAFAANPATIAVAALLYAAKNDFWKDPDGYKRSYAGLLTAPTAGAEGSTFAVDPFASGFSPMGIARGATQQSAIAQINVYRELDAAGAEYVRKLGGNVDLSRATLAGVGKEGTAGTSGTLLGTGGMTTAADLAAMTDLYMTQFADHITGLDKELLRAVQSADSAEEIMGLLADAIAEQENQLSDMEAARKSASMSILAAYKSGLTEIDAIQEAYDAFQKYAERGLTAQHIAKFTGLMESEINAVIDRGAAMVKAEDDKKEKATASTPSNYSINWGELETMGAGIRKYSVNYDAEYLAEIKKAFFLAGMNEFGESVVGMPRAANLAQLDGSHASGLDYVPFDGYVAQLHKGERVVPAAENMRGGAPVSNEMRDMITEMRKIALFTKRTSDLLLRVTRDGESLVTVSA